MLALRAEFFLFVGGVAVGLQLGARTFLKMEYSAIAVMVAILFVLVSAAVNWRTGICYIVRLTVRTVVATSKCAKLAADWSYCSPRACII